MSKLIDNYDKMYNKEMVSVIHTAFEDVPRVVAMVWVNSKNSMKLVDGKGSLRIEKSIVKNFGR